MKKILTYTSLALSVLLSFSCQTDLDFALPAEKLGFSKTELLSEVSVFNGGSDVAIIKSGKGKEEGNATLVTCTAGDIEKYNESKVDPEHYFVAIDPSMYTISETDFHFSKEDIRKIARITWNSDAIAQKYAGVDAVVPLRLTGGGIAVDDARSMIFVMPYVSTLGFSETCAQKIFYPSKASTKPTDVFTGTGTLELDKPVSSSEVEVELFIDNSLIKDLPSGKVPYEAAPEGLIVLKDSKVTITAGENYGSFEFSVDCSKLFKDGKFIYNDKNFCAPIAIKTKSPAGLADGLYMASYAIVRITDTGEIDPPTTPSKDYVGNKQWNVLDGQQWTIGEDPSFNEGTKEWYRSNYPVSNFVDGNFVWQSGAVATWWDTPNIFPIEFVFDLGKDYIYNGFRLVDGGSYQNNFVHIQVYSAVEYEEGGNTNWNLCFEGTRKFRGGWQQWPGNTKEALDKTHTFHMPEDADENFTKTFKYTHGQYLKLVLVEPQWTAGDFVNGRGWLMEFYINGWER